jgi:hypothetical protein
LRLVPAWLVIASLLGVINAAACFMLFGRKVAYLGWYAVVGALVGSLGQVFGEALNTPAPIQIGEVNLLVASLLVWGVLGTARVLGR